MSASMIAFVVTLALGGTQAFFSDEEVSEGNTFAAGAIDLQVDNTSYGFDWNDPTVQDPEGDWGLNEANSWTLSDLDDELFFSFTDLKPGDYGEDTISLHVDFNDAYACMAFDLTATPENGQNEPEADADATAGADEGELQNYLSFLFWNDDGDNVLETGEEIIEDLSGLPGEIFGGDWLAIAEGGDTPLVGNSVNYIGKGWCFGEMTATPVAQDGVNNNPPDAPSRIGFTCNGAGDHNDAQTDGITVDVGFYAIQSRNNGDFSCASLPPLDGNGTTTPPVERETVGAVLGDYSISSTTCDATVSGSSSIQTALDAAAVDGTVCVADNYDGTADNVALRMETTGVTLAAVTQGTALDVPVVLSADGVTVTGFTGSIGQAESVNEVAAFYLDIDATNATLSFNEVSGGGVGAAILTETGASLGGGLITNNTLSGAIQGIYLNPHTGTIVIEYNDISDNVAGIAGLNGATVRNNEFAHTVAGSEAIGIDSTFDANPATINFNNFLNDVKVADYGATPVVNAENNFFSNGGVNQTTTPADFDFTPEEASALPQNV